MSDSYGTSSVDPIKSVTDSSLFAGGVPVSFMESHEHNKHKKHMAVIRKDDLFIKFNLLKATCVISFLLIIR